MTGGDKPNENNTKANPTPGEGASIGLGLAVCGGLLHLFPRYADITSDWSYLYALFGYLLYLMGIIVAIGTVSGEKSEGFQMLGLGGILFFLAFLFHDFAERVGRDSLGGFILEHLVLIFGSLGSIAALMAVPRLLAGKPKSETTDSEPLAEKAPLQTPAALSSIRSEHWLERAVALAITVLALITAILQFMDSSMSG